MRHKFNAKQTCVHDVKFPSKLEASYYQTLLLAKKSGQILFFLRQVPFHLPGNTQYRADFVLFFADGSCSIVEVKGRDTPMSILKRKQVEDLYPVKIEVIKKA